MGEPFERTAINCIPFECMLLVGILASGSMGGLVRRETDFKFTVSVVPKLMISVELRWGKGGGWAATKVMSINIRVGKLERAEGRSGGRCSSTSTWSGWSMPKGCRSCAAWKRGAQANRAWPFCGISLVKRRAKRVTWFVGMNEEISWNQASKRLNSRLQPLATLGRGWVVVA